MARPTKKPTKKRRAILNVVAARKEKRRALLVEVDAVEPPAIEMDIPRPLVYSESEESESG
ncbi:hypothetical protein BDZ91DRAFT_716425 [Kalaharituber pfeilii]|nr:hypothetical protein BDZ91DRAFT_716425 [Kalaharituber pfeilii]